MKKYSQSFLIISVVVLSTTLILSSNHTVYAMKSLGEDSSINRIGPEHYGLNTKQIVCGDRLCIQPSADHISNAVTHKIKNMLDNPNNNPFIKIGQVFHYSKQDQNAYSVIVKVTAGKKDLRNIQLLVHSDMEEKTIPIDGLFAQSGQSIQVRIHSQESNSIIANINHWEYSE